ncbi:cytochrome P450 [Acrasis kona]|uniref:Cytochrome P450 n=1 Tax=Acrasis kona TaxID=1008807 RepID=A0AAW2YH21_9EUKA
MAGGNTSPRGLAVLLLFLALFTILNSFFLNDDGYDDYDPPEVSMSVQINQPTAFISRKCSNHPFGITKSKKFSIRNLPVGSRFDSTWFYLMDSNIDQGNLIAIHPRTSSNDPSAPYGFVLEFYSTNQTNGCEWVKRYEDQVEQSTLHFVQKSHDQVCLYLVHSVFDPTNLLVAYKVTSYCLNGNHKVISYSWPIKGNLPITAVSDYVGKDKANCIHVSFQNDAVEYRVICRDVDDQVTFHTGPASNKTSVIHDVLALHRLSEKTLIFKEEGSLDDIRIGTSNVETAARNALSQLTYDDDDLQYEQHSSREFGVSINAKLIGNDSSYSVMRLPFGAKQGLQKEWNAIV